MQKIIYSKYSNERKDTFKIRTSIILDNEGRKSVEKTPLTLEAHQHIDNIQNSYELLKYQYKNSAIQINKVKRKNTNLVFEYLSGITLEEYLDELLEKKDYEKICTEIKKYVNIITSTKDIIDFKSTKAFEDIFGDIRFSTNLKSCTISNIDTIFSNVIIADTWNLIDYEWVFEFPIPFNFSIYRALTTYIQSSFKRESLKELGIYQLCGITHEEIKLYKIMEQRFQTYVNGLEISGLEIYAKIKGTNYYVEKLIQKENQETFKHEIQIFYDYGDGFSEVNSFRSYLQEDKEGKIKLDTYLPPNIRGLRIDPGNQPCILQVDYLLGYEDCEYEMVYAHNGESINAGTVLYSTNDPQLVCSNIQGHTVRLRGEFQICLIPEIMCLQVCNIIYEKNKINAERAIQQDKIEAQKIEKNILKNKVIEQQKDYEKLVHDKDYEIKNLIRTIEDEKTSFKRQLSILEVLITEKENYINTIHQTKVWRFYTKYRKLKEKMKRK